MPAPVPAPPLTVHTSSPITAAFFLLMVLAALCFGQYVAGLYVPRRYRLSNRRARLGSCPPSSASTAENSPATDHAAQTASKNAPHASTPDPSPTPPGEDWDRRTAYVLAQWWQQHRHAPSAGSHPYRVIRSPQTTPSRVARAGATRRYGQCTDHATAGPGGSSQDQRSR